MNERITGREKQILKLVAIGLTNKEIGQKLDISVFTVDNHCSKIYRKLQVRDRWEAVDKAGLSFEPDAKRSSSPS